METSSESTTPFTYWNQARKKKIKPYSLLSLSSVKSTLLKKNKLKITLIL